MCKILSNKKKLGRGGHTSQTCFSCSGKQAADWFNLMNIKRQSSTLCPVEHDRSYIIREYWARFGFHKGASCKCTKEDKNNLEHGVAYPMQCPFEMGEMTGEFYGWIDKKLSVLSFFLTGIMHRFPELKDVMVDLVLLVLGMRATYWYLATSEKKSYITEVLFTTNVTKDKDKENKMFLRADMMIATTNKKNVWWETFLFHMADFYKRLGWTKYLSFDIVLADARKRKEFLGLEAIHSHAVSWLEQPIKLPHETTLPNQAGAISDLLTLLSEGTKCNSCQRDLGGMKATWMLQNKIYQPFWEEALLVREDNVPIIFEYPSASEQNDPDTRSKWTLVCCRSTKCVRTVSKKHLDWIESWARLSINWLFKSQRCHGCLKFCPESHRCSSCRSVRYCSKACLSQDWKAHQASCKNMALEPSEAISTRKLEGRPRSALFAKCMHYMRTSDPFFEHFSGRWRDEGLTVDDLVVPPAKKEKEKSLKDTSVKYKKKKKDMASNTDPIQTENQAKLDDEDVQTNKKISKEVDEGLKLSKDDNRKRPGNKSEEKQKKGQNAKEEPEMEEVIFHHKENGTDNTDAVYIKGRVSKSDMKTDNIQEELEEMLARNGFDIDNIKITTMKCISNGQNKEECLKDAMASQSSCKECKCEISKNDPKEEKVESSKEVTYTTEKTTDVLQKERELCLTKLDQFRKDIEKRHFEIRHIKTHPWMNGRICRVEDVSGRKSRYDPRLVCSIKGDEEEGKLYSIKPSTMVDCYVEVEDLDIYSCHNNSLFKKQEEDGLCEKMVLSFLARALLWMEDQGNNLVHQQAR